MDEPIHETFHDVSSYFSLQSHLDTPDKKNTLPQYVLNYVFQDFPL